MQGAEALELSLPFDEGDVLLSCTESLCSDLALQLFEVASWPPSAELAASQPAVAKLAPPTPGHPTCFFY